jgi:probable F420-dependent oxidoreductase
MPVRPFRFGVQGRAAESAAAWRARARRAEDLGYDTFLVPDHFPRGLGPIAALMAAADATTTLRVGTFVFDNDFRHPVVLAKEVTTLDLLSGGRFELGIGAGWFRAEYEAAGLPFAPASERIARLEESLRVLKALFGEGPVTFAGAHYTLTAMNMATKPVQRPHPPILVGGGARRILSLAAREADIVGLGPRSRADGTTDAGSISRAATEQKLAWVREAAGARLDALELNVFVYEVAETDDRAAVAAAFAENEIPVETVLDSPHTLIGSLDSMVEDLERRREEYGLSYIVVPEDKMEPLAPIIARLKGR